MKNRTQSKDHPTHSILGTMHTTIVAAILSVALPQAAHAEAVNSPEVPANIQTPPAHQAFLVGHAVGTQNYVCRRSGPDVKFILFAPEAILTKDDRQLTSHFFSPNPFEANNEPTVVSDHMIRATWRHSRDTSTVWAKMAANGSSSVAPKTIPWLLLEVVGARPGPGGGDTLTAATFIQRVNTSGGVAPSVGCGSPSEIGNQAFVPYTADYVFYKKAGERDTAAGQALHSSGENPTGVVAAATARD